MVKFVVYALGTVPTVTVEKWIAATKQRGARPEKKVVDDPNSLASIASPWQVGFKADAATMERGIDHLREGLPLVPRNAVVAGEYGARSIAEGVAEQLNVSQKGFRMLQDAPPVNEAVSA